MFDFMKAESAIKSAVAEKNKLHRELEEAKKRREDLITLPLPKADFIEWCIERIDTDAELYISDVEVALQGIHRWGFHDYDRKDLRLGFLHFNHDGRPGTYGLNTNQIRPTAIAWLLGDLMKERLRAALERADLQWPKEVGPTRKERAKELPPLEKKIAELEMRVKDFTAKVSELGIAV